MTAVFSALWLADRGFAVLPLLRARELVRSIGEDWRAWCVAHVPRSERDIRKLLALARAGDPEAALAEERRQTREPARERRAGVRADVRPASRESDPSAPRAKYSAANAPKLISATPIAAHPE
jgi:hypothetical protein